MIRRPFVALRLMPGPGHRTETNKHPMEDYHDGHAARSARFNHHPLLEPARVHEGVSFGVVRHTRARWELIVIDNGSTDGTGTYLAGVQDAVPVPVTVVSNARNLGFPAAINQGLKAARGDYLVLLNNDAVVTDAWLDQLIALAEMEEEGTTKNTKDTKGESGRGNRVRMRIGLTGPMSNYASPPQLVENVPYANLEEMNEFARRWRHQPRGQWFTTGKLSGFCLLMKRAVFEAVGGLDERFGLGLFDDNDLAERARRAGFELAVAHDLFVHHFGSRTFAGAGIDAEKLLQENSDKFSRKWGIPEVGQRVALGPWVPGGNGPQISQIDADETTRNSGNPETNGHRTGSAGRPDAFHLRSSAKSADKRSSVSMSLTMIVIDEHANIFKCFSSVAGLFDEIVVVDTGSQDRTRESAREFGARVFDFVWVDDFAAARNAALARATGDYAFWLDADDVVDPPEREKLRKLLDGLPGGRGGGRALRWASRERSTHPTSCPRGCRAAVAGAEALRWASRGRSTHPTRRGRSSQPMATTWMGRRRMWCSARVIRGRTGMAGRRSSIISGSFRSARTCDGATRCTSRSCRPCGGRTCQCGGPISQSGTPAIPTRRCESGSSSAIARSSKRNWPSGPPIRSCCLTWARSPSSGRTGQGRSSTFAAASPAQLPPIRSRASCSP